MSVKIGCPFPCRSWDSGRIWDKICGLKEYHGDGEKKKKSIIGYQRSGAAQIRF